MNKQDFTATANTAATVAEAMQLTGYTSYTAFMARCGSLRRAGYDVKRFGRPGRMGLLGWLETYHPAVYQDLKENYPAVYADNSG